MQATTRHKTTVISTHQYRVYTEFIMFPFLPPVNEWLSGQRVCWQGEAGAAGLGTVAHSLYCTVLYCTVLCRSPQSS